MSRTLILLRHAKSDWAEDLPDPERPLAERGRKDAPAAGRWLREHVRAIDLVVCSPAARTRETWTLASQELEVVPPMRLEPRMYTAAVDDLMSVVHDLPDEASTAVLIGHNPGLTDMVWTLSRSEVGLKTASIAVVRGEGDWLDAAPHWAELTDFVTPRG